MIEKDARFYFANLLADVSRCVRAARDGNDERYRDSLARSYRTLKFLRGAHRPECYEEALLLLRALHFARVDGTLAVFNEQLQRLALYHTPHHV